MPDPMEPTEPPGAGFSRIFSRTGFRGPVLTLLSGASLSMGISFLTGIVLTRLFTPAEFGVANYFVAVLSVLVTFASFRYEDAVMLPAGDEEAASVAWGALLLVAGFSLLYAALIPWRIPIAAALNLEGVAPWLPLIPVALGAMRSMKVLENWLTRKKQFPTVSAGQVGATLSQSGLRLAAGAVPATANAGGLIGGFVGAQIVGAMVYAASVGRRSGPAFRAGLNLGGICRALVRYRKFSFFSTPSAVLNAVVARLPLLVLPFFLFDESVLGLYGLAVNVLGVPLSLVGAAIAPVFFVHAAESHRRNALAGVAEGVHRRLVMLGMFPALAAVLAGPEICAFVYGDPWRPAGEYLRILSPWLFLAAVASPLSRLFDVLERQKTDLLTTAAGFVLLSTALVLGGASGDIHRVLLLLTMAGVLVRVAQIGILTRLAGVSLAATIRPYPVQALLALPFLLPAGVAAWRGFPDAVVVGLVGAGGGGYYLWLAWRENFGRSRTTV